MKKLLAVAVVMLMATSAFAVVDPDTNMIGVYFDESADTNTMTGAAPYATFPIYVILTNPDFDYLYGFEFGYNMEGNGQVLSGVFANPQALDVGQPGNHIVGFGSPSPCTEATLLMTLNFLYLEPAGCSTYFNLSGSTPSSNDLGLPTLLLADGVLITTGYSTVDGSHAAVINPGGCAGEEDDEEPVATDAMTFDSVKSLYR